MHTRLAIDRDKLEKKTEEQVELPVECQTCHKSLRAVFEREGEGTQISEDDLRVKTDNGLTVVGTGMATGSPQEFSLVTFKTSA